LFPQAYLKAVEEYKEGNPDGQKGYFTEEWWLRPEYQEATREMEERFAKKEGIVLDERTKEIEGIAREWAKREYFRKTMDGTMDADMTQEEYTKSVWERAMFEGDLRYRQYNGEVTDKTTELADFKKIQERKQAVMLKRAKEEMRQILEEDDLLDDEMAAYLSTDEEVKTTKKVDKDEDETESDDEEED
jgi:hypothetical protein